LSRGIGDILGPKSDMLKAFPRNIAFFALCFLTIHCAYHKEEQYDFKVDWTSEEKKQDFVMKTLKVTPESSFHLIRMKKSEKPHIHANHDLKIFVLKGKAKLHLGENVSVVKSGDAFAIPRGMVHYAENLGRGASEVYVIFTPPYDGKDHHPVPVEHP
jgi:mannose-6-phosphate isomerase-like protein (cupin superfamily)